MNITPNINCGLWLISCILCLVPWTTSAATKGRYNITFAELDSCDTYEITEGGYAYKDFFIVHSLDNNNIKNDERLHLKFYVLTSMDAHILLSVTDRPRPHDRVYEIVIGAGGNTFSAIRTSMGLRRVSTNQDQHLLSIYDPTPIEIIQTKDGNLQVFIPGFKTEPLLRFLDASALTINYVSFSTFGPNTARWFYDCAFDGFDKELDPEQRSQSVEEQLLGALVYQAQNQTQPATLSSIRFAFLMRALTYEQSNALLRTRIALTLSWQDPRLSWEPTQYGNIKTFSHPDLEIWIPNLLVLNGALESQIGLLKNFELRVSSNGTVTVLDNNLELISWCVDAARNWPNERLSCDIILGTEQGVALDYDANSDPLSPHEHVNILSAWTFAEFGVSQLQNDTNTRYATRGMLQTMAGDVAIEFRLQRNGSFYRQVFVMPLIACQIFIVLSFLLRGYRRGALILIVLALTACGLLYMTKHATPHYVPPLMGAYQHIMQIAAFCYFLHIALMWMERYPPRVQPFACLMALMNSSILRLLLCLRLADSTKYCDIQEQPWRELAKLCNNLCFIVINLLLISVDVLQLSVY
ncbi:acetylcholine receptor subunit beta [Scaptodrosophila lebanonensis]|uniref:Acetylcholine receptor subunit beta n=1 Tax=Drosophila lebanonensis TaxID=7225 RepID=A0A6J2T7X7_DROLE|nr:acetylcholine receptor subunit beta [Scaptodrosophila lebanonensis]